MARGLSIIALLLALPGGFLAAQTPARDTPAQKDAPKPPAGRISGRVVASDTGRPVKRARVIGGRVLDEDGDAMPGVMVRVMRYQYQQGERRLTPAGTAQTDDRGQFRV